MLSFVALIEFYYAVKWFGYAKFLMEYVGTLCNLLLNDIILLCNFVLSVCNNKTVICITGIKQCIYCAFQNSAFTGIVK